jgi:tetratricopeptide (TPR) repeat protein
MHERGYLATGWFWFLGMLVPVIGLVQVGDQAWADRYTYLPSIGIFIIVVWGIAEACSSRRQEALISTEDGRWQMADGSAAMRAGGATQAPSYLPSPISHLPLNGASLRRLLQGLGLLVSIGLLVSTSIQLGYWKDTRTLFEHANQVTEKNPLAETLLGSLLDQEGKLDQAMQHYQTALRYSPGFPEAHFFLGHALDQQGKLDQAIAEYQKAIWFKPMQERTHIFLGAALTKQHQAEAAAIHYREALKLNPDSAVAHNSLAKLLHTEGRLDEALDHYSRAVRLDPDLPQAHNNFGILLLQKGHLPEGTTQLREALRLKPGDPESQLNLAQALAQQEQWGAAAELFAKVVTPAITDPNIHCQFAIVLAHLQKTREAMSHYASALLLQPDFPAALDGLCWILSTSPNPQFRNGAEAVHMAERACELTQRKDPARLKTLAAAYAESGRFTEAADTARKALDLAAEAGRKDLAEECRTMLEQFKAAKPWRDRTLKPEI